MKLETALRKVRSGWTIAREDDERIVIEPSDLKEDTITFEREDFEKEWVAVRSPLFTDEEYCYLEDIVTYAYAKIEWIARKKYVGEERYYLEIAYEDEAEVEYTPSFDLMRFRGLELNKRYTLADFDLSQGWF